MFVTMKGTKQGKYGTHLPTATIHCSDIYISVLMYGRDHYSYMEQEHEIFSACTYYTVKWECTLGVSTTQHNTQCGLELKQTFNSLGYLLV